jgi:hypothetical protein
VLCLFRLVPEPDANQAHRNIKVVRLNTTAGEDLRDWLWGRPPNGVSFRSHWELYQWVDVYNNTLYHELGHALGQDHILALQGDVKCKTGDPNADRCYEGDNVMGGNSDKVALINALAWHERIEQHTRKDKRWWRVVLGDTTPTRKVRLADWDPKRAQMF